MPTLVYWDSDGAERNFDIGAEPVLIGRASECAIRSEDTRVSRRHARIVYSNEGCWIEDLGSANGVYVGSKKVAQAFIPPGEIAVVGSIILQLQPEEGQPPPITNGTHTQLCVWLKIEREARAALIDERNALGLRVSELHKELAREAQGSGGTLSPSAEQIEQMRADFEASKEAELARMRGEFEAELRQVTDRMRAEFEAERTQERARVRAEALSERQPEIDALQNELAQLRTGSEETEKLQKQVRQLWTNLRAAKQHISQLEEDAQVQKTRHEAEEEARAKLQEHARKLAGEVKRLREVEKQREEGQVGAEARVAALEARVAELTTEAERLREAERGAWAQNDALSGEVERLRSAVADARAQIRDLTAVREERDRLKFELDIARAELDELRTAGADVQTQYTAELRAAQSRVEMLSIKLEETRAAAAVAEQETVRRLTAAEEENNRLRDNLSDANNALYKLRSTLDRASAELDELRASGATAREKVEGQLTTLSREKDRLERELAAAREEVVEVLRAAEARVQAARGESAMLEEQRSRMSAELEELRNASANAEREQSARQSELENQRRELDKERTRLANEVSILREKNIELVAKLKAADMAHGELESELAEVHHQLETTEITRNAAEDARKRLTAELETVRREAETHRQAANELRGQVARLQSEVDGARMDSNRAQNAELAAARQRAERLAAELDGLRKDSERLRSEVAQAASERTLRRAAEEQQAKLKERIAALENQLATRQAAPARPAVPAAVGEHIMTLQDCVAALRASMRAASDETAVMPGDSTSVQVIADALTDATEQIERARDSLRHLEKLLG